MRPEPVTVADGDALREELALDAVISRFNGDQRAALSAALEDIAFLQRELTLAGLAMSYGYARGWRPKCAS